MTTTKKKNKKKDKSKAKAKTKKKIAKKSSKKKAGRKPLFKTPEDMQKLIDKYFSEECADTIVKDKESGKPYFNRQGGLQVQHNPPTIDGLSLYLGFADRQSMYDYEKKPLFTCTIKRARSRMADYAQKQLFAGNSTGAIFWLKNHGWYDRQQSQKVDKDGKPTNAPDTVIVTADDAAKAYKEFIKKK